MAFKPDKTVLGSAEGGNRMATPWGASVFFGFKALPLRTWSVPILLGAMVSIFSGAEVFAQDADGQTLRLEGMSIVPSGGDAAGPTMVLEGVAIKPWSGTVEGPTLHLEVGKGAQTNVPEPGSDAGLIATTGLLGLLASRRCRAARSARAPLLGPG
jgi:hypothetical protein